MVAERRIPNGDPTSPPRVDWDRKIEPEVSATDDDVAGKTTEAELTEPRPQESDRDEHETNRNQPPSDHLISGR